MERFAAVFRFEKTFGGLRIAALVVLVFCISSCGGEPQVKPADQAEVKPPDAPDTDTPVDTETPAGDTALPAVDAGAAATDTASEEDTAEPDEEPAPDAGAEDDTEEKPQPKKVSRGPAAINFAASKGVVKFKHRKHQGRAGCKACHHKQEPKTTPKACRACHGKSASPMKQALHSKCKGCHQTKGGPSKCDECHGA